MSKVKLNELSEKELLDMHHELTEDINKLDAIIEASNSTVFDLLIDETKKEMKANVLEESWKKLKENIKKIEQYRTIETTLQNQQELLERKKDELEDVNNAIMYRQQSLFDCEADAETACGEQDVEHNDCEADAETACDEQDVEHNDSEADREIEAEDSGYTFGNTLQPIETGDIFVNENSNPSCYYFIKKSKNDKDFAIIGNSIEDELLLNYPKNREMLNDAEYIGNIYYGQEDKEAALKAYNEMKRLINPN